MKEATKSVFVRRNLVIASALAMSLAGSAAWGQATRTWVSGVGDDANPCSRTAPCKTFAGAISKTAAGGEINVLDPGGFGGVTITKSITIDGSPHLSGVLVSGTNAIIINAGTNDVVTLRNLDINGLNTGLAGIRFLGGKALYVDNCKIYGFSGLNSGRGIDFAPTNASGNVAQLVVMNSHIKDNLTNPTGGGIVVTPPAGFTARVVVDNVRLERNHIGLLANPGSVVYARNSVSNFNRNEGWNATANGTPSTIFLDNCGSAFNTTGALATGNGALIRMTDCSITGNTTGISAVSSGVIESFSTSNSNDGNTTDGVPSPISKQ